MFGKELFNIKLRGLLEDPSYEINAKDKFGNTILHQAVRYPNYKMIKLLIEKGADVNAKDESGITPLHEAVFCGKKDIENICALLEEGADVNAVDESGNTALHYASLMGYPSKVRELLAAGANANVKNNIGRTPLHQAVFMRKLECVKMILEAGSNIDAPDNEGYTPMYLAYKGDVEKIISALEKNDRVRRRIVNVAGLYATSREQIEELENRITKDGYKLLKENEFLNKRGLKSLRRKAEEGKIDIVYVNSPEDLAKEFKDQIILLGELWKLGIDVIFISEKVRVSIPQNLIYFRSNYSL